MSARTEPRFHTDHDAFIRVIREKAITFACRLLDTSATGFRIRLGEPLEVGESVQVIVQDSSVLATVRYCKPEGDGHLAGIELADEWRKDWGAGRGLEEQAAGHRAAPLPAPCDELDGWDEAVSSAELSPASWVDEAADTGLARASRPIVRTRRSRDAVGTAALRQLFAEASAGKASGRKISRRVAAIAGIALACVATGILYSLR